FARAASRASGVGALNSWSASHVPQSGHLPIHLGWSEPQWLQRNWFRALAIGCDCKRLPRGEPLCDSCYDACMSRAPAPMPLTPQKNGVHLFRLFGVDVYVHWLWLIVGAYEINSRAKSYT